MPGRKKAAKERNPNFLPARRVGIARTNYGNLGRGPGLF